MFPDFNSIYLARKCLNRSDATVVHSITNIDNKRWQRALQQSYFYPAIHAATKWVIDFEPRLRLSEIETTPKSDAQVVLEILYIYTA